MKSDFQRHTNGDEMPMQLLNMLRLLLTRPGFGHSSSLTETTATAVESLVYGEIYDYLVVEEIKIVQKNTSFFETTTN